MAFCIPEVLRHLSKCYSLLLACIPQPCSKRKRSTNLKRKLLILASHAKFPPDSSQVNNQSTKMPDADANCPLSSFTNKKQVAFCQLTNNFALYFYRRTVSSIRIEQTNIFVEPFRVFPLNCLNKLFCYCRLKYP